MNRAERRKYRTLGVSNKAIMDKTLSDMYEQGVKDGEKEIKEKIKSELEKARKRLAETFKLSKEVKTKEETTLWWTAQIRADERINTLEELLKYQK